MLSRTTMMLTPAKLTLALAFLAAACDGSPTPATEGVGGTPITGAGGTSTGTTPTTVSGGGSAGAKTGTSTRNAGGTSARTSTAQTGGKTSQTSATGGAGGSAGSTSATGGKTSATTATGCSNGVKDGSETGIDCGGSCAACVTYVTSQPKSDDNLKSACDGGDGYICPRFMLFSPEMIQAAKDDAAANGWPGDAFNYGVATLDGEACCSCFQVVYDKPTYLKTTNITPPKSLVVQMFNTGAGGHVDVFMGKGGMGAFQQGCPRMYSTFPDTGENPWNGGIRASNMSACGTEASSLSSSTCSSAVKTECDKIVGKSDAVTTTTRTSCVQANSASSYYHENWNIRVRKVACPTHLTDVTGCKPNDDSSLPKADPKVQTASQATGSGWQDKQSTSMQDCCKPSCSWSGKTSNMKSGWESLYTCTQAGVPITK
ncbi:MAG: hypothetical protein QM784_01390 [Polyangiaceae bacterium]